jgi:hypothetical protein
MTACGAAAPAPTPQRACGDVALRPAVATNPPTAPDAATTPGEKPFQSTQSLPAHREDGWLVFVEVASDAHPHLDEAPPPPDKVLSYLGRVASELTAGDFEVPGTRWICRYDRVHVVEDIVKKYPDSEHFLYRQFACTADDWHTFLASDAEEQKEPLTLVGDGKRAEVAIGRCSNMTLSEWKALLAERTAKNKGGEMRPAPCPTSGDVVDGRLVSGIHNDLKGIRMVLLTGDAIAGH